jgi:hypothetical protein
MTNPKTLEATEVAPDYPDTPENRQMAIAIERVLKCPAAPPHSDLSNWSIGSLIVTIQTLQADLLNTSNPDLRLRVARELASLHKALQAWSVEPTSQNKGGK